MSLVPPLRPAAGLAFVAGVALASTLLIGCAPGMTRAGAVAGTPSIDAAATVTVTNDDDVEVRLYAVSQNGTRWLLGDLRARSTATFAIPRGIPLPGDVQILGVSMALRVPRATEPATVLPGDRLEVTLRSPENLSTLLKRR